MKKLICLVLCIVLLGCLLVSCKNDEIGADLDRLKDKVPDKTVEEMELDFYIIVGEGTTENAKKTVTLMINQYLEKFKTKLDIHYLTAAEYEDKVKNDIALDGDERADIVLVTSKDMFDYLYDNRLIANLNDFYHPTASIYRSLNTQIAPSLLSAVTVRETAYTKNGFDYVEYIAQNKYCVPNNRVVGTYGIFLMTVEAAEYYNIGPDTFNSLTADEAAERIYSKIDTDPQYSREESVIYTNGNYAELQSYINSGKYYVKYTNPTVSLEEAYESVFVIARHDKDLRHTKGWQENTLQTDIDEYTNYYNRCMEIIYDLNTSTEFRNLLLYGKVNTNYKLDRETLIVNHNNIADSDVYVMDIAYTGDVFKAYYCECDGMHDWTKEAALNGEQQNKEAVFSPDERVSVEKGLLSFTVNERVESNMTVTLPTAGVHYSEVVVKWTVNGEELVGGKLVIKQTAEDVTLNIVATLICTEGNVTAEQTVNYTVVVAGDPDFNE